jgi:uncharacterized protein
MPEFIEPGVNVDETPYGSKPIQGVTTGSAGFVGPAQSGPTSGKLLALTSFAEFERIYGGLEPLNFSGKLTPNYLAFAARAFFAEGGKRLYIARILQERDQDLPPAQAYRGSGDGMTGLAALESIEEIAIVAAPGSSANYSGENRSRVDEITDSLIQHSEKMRYRMAVLDMPDGLNPDEARAYRARLDSSYAALYYPWVWINDSRAKAALKLPPSGFITGVYARNDSQRGVSKAPSNLGLRSVAGLEIPLTKPQLDLLNEQGINCLRAFQGRGYRVWGARTTSSDPEWKYVNLRRYNVYLEHSIDRGTQWVVFEPNGEALWANVRRTVEDFLFNEWQSGALQGTKPEQAYFVHCDRSTMTQNDLDNGRLVCLIGVATVRPAEFVIIRIGQWTADRPTR